jgi:hypothetical protein
MNNGLWSVDAYQKLALNSELRTEVASAVESNLTTVRFSAFPLGKARKR